MFDLSGRYGSLTTINAELNGGHLELDLTGEWGKDIELKISGGTGNEVRLILPQDVGAAITIESDTNKVTAEELTFDGNTYTNEAYGKSGITLNILIQFARGEVTLTTTQ